MERSESGNGGPRIPLRCMRATGLDADSVTSHRQKYKKFTR